MKAKELIKELQKLNPEAEVVVGGEAIHFVEELPGYYDGYYQVLKENPQKKPFYAVEGLIFTEKNTKIKLHTLSLEDIIWNCESDEELENLSFTIDDSIRSDIHSKIKEIKEAFRNRNK